MPLYGLVITHHTGPTLPRWGAWQVRHLSGAPMSRAQNLMPNGDLECIRYLFYSRQLMVSAMTRHLEFKCTCDIPDEYEVCPSYDDEPPLDRRLPAPAFGQRVNSVTIAHLADHRRQLTGQWLVVRTLSGSGPSRTQYLESVGLKSEWVDTPVVSTRIAALTKLALTINNEIDFAHKIINSQWRAN